MKNYQPHIELFNNSADGMVMVEADRFIDCNDAMVKILGYRDKMELLQLHPSEISPAVQPDGSPSFEEANKMSQIALKNGNNRFHWMHRRADGSEFWCEVSLTKIHIDGRDVIYAVVRDINDEKLAQERLEATKQQMEDIITHFPVAIVRAEVDNVNVGYFNNRFHELFGWELADISTMEKWFAKAYPDAAYRQKIVGEWDELIKKTHAMGLVTSPHPMEARVHCKNGDVKTCLGWYHRNAGNVFGIFHDITAQREAEEHLKKALDELAAKNRQLEEVNASLDNRVRDEIEKQRRQEQILIQQSKMAAMGEMIGAIAHQWRQPLNIIALKVQDIQDAYAFGEMNEAYLDETVKSSMEVINYMSQTIDDFRNFFKPNKEKKYFSLIPLVEEAIKIVAVQFTSNNIVIRTDYRCPTGCEVEGYPSEIKQLMLNLFNNSKDAINHWRKTHNENREGNICITIDETEPEVTLAIEDNGGGIPEAVMEKIFDPYFSTKPQGEGTGLGLYMSKIIIDKHMKGSISAENSAEGARFVIRFRRGSAEAG